MENITTGKIAGITEQVQYFWQGLDFWHSPYAILDIILVALILYWGYLLLKETRAMRIMYGIVILALVFLAGRVFNLAALNFILKYLMTMIVVAIPVVFQPELRAMLERLGRAKIISDFSNLRRTEIKQILEEILHAAETLSKNKIGALMVIAQKTGLREYTEKGTKLEAIVSEDLLLSIFTPNTPLHDGAVIISGSKILAAGCTLPLAEDRFDFSVGTRHRAALGLSQQSDAIIIVVSEEKGSVSLAYNGVLSRDIGLDRLEQLVLEILEQKRLEIERKKLSTK